jgi:translation initiation factor 4G
VKLLTCYIRSEPLPEPEIQAREVQCLYGIQIMSAALEHPGGLLLRIYTLPKFLCIMIEKFHLH